MPTDDARGDDYRGRHITFLQPKILNTYLKSKLLPDIVSQSSAVFRRIRTYLEMSSGQGPPGICFRAYSELWHTARLPQQSDNVVRSGTGTQRNLKTPYSRNETRLRVSLSPQTTISPTATNNYRPTPKRPRDKAESSPPQLSRLLSLWSNIHDSARVGMTTGSDED
jgi:hypothetical protein